MSEIEEDFLESWDRIRTFYDGASMRLFLGNDLADLMVQLVDEIQGAGYSLCLRAGQAMHELILSRSRSHGTLGQQYIRFRGEFGRYRVNGVEKTCQGLLVSYYANDTIVEEFEEESIALTNRIQALLQRLSEQPLHYTCGEGES